MIFALALGVSESKVQSQKLKYLVLNFKVWIDNKVENVICICVIDFLIFVTQRRIDARRAASCRVGAKEEKKRKEENWVAMVLL